jgi:hypothetical protein
MSAACGPVTIGHKCGGGGDCGNNEKLCVSGFNGQPKICTHACATNADCPLGYDCAQSDGPSKTCNKTLYVTDKMTGDPVLFGKPCTTDDSECMGTADLNPSPTCRKGNAPSEAKPVALATDPNAYCTGSCTNDQDCPLPMKCDVDYDGVTKCLKRNVCDPCKYDENCGYSAGVFASEFTACVPTKDGSDFYCSKPCGTQKDCPGAAKMSAWMVCDSSTDTDGNSGMFCLHWFGACVGNGQICDPCRSNGDCTAVAGTKCVDNPYGFYSYPFTGEKMCNKGCASDASCAGPNMDTCDDTDLPTNANPLGTSTGMCTDDPTHKHPGVFSCHILAN